MNSTFINDLNISISFMAVPCLSQQNGLKLIKKKSIEFFKSTLKARVASLKVFKGIPALHVAAFHCNIEVVEYLIQTGADPNSLSNYDNSTALHMAVLGGSKKIVEILLANGSVQSIKNSSGHTPMHLCCLKGDITLLKILCRGPNAKKAAQLTDKEGKKPNEVCTRSYSRSVLEGIMKDSNLAIRPLKSTIFD